MSKILLTQLNIYPIKSCGGISLHNARLEERGLQYDRRWMVVDQEGRFLTQREVPRLALVSVQISSGALRLVAPQMKELLVPMQTAGGKSTPVVVWDDTVEAVDVGEAAAKWFSEFLGFPAQLVHMPDTADRLASRGGYTSQVSFADAYPLLLISEDSLEDLNTRLEVPLPMNRFRPNLVVSGCAPYAEDSWKEIRISGMRLHVVKPCARCVTTTVNQATGEKGKEPLKTLATYREQDGKVMFGQNLIHEGKGVLEVGSRVEILC